jgi:hypothetical protein
MARTRVLPSSSCSRASSLGTVSVAYSGVGSSPGVFDCPDPFASSDYTVSLQDALSQRVAVGVHVRCISEFTSWLKIICVIESFSV